MVGDGTGATPGGRWWRGAEGSDGLGAAWRAWRRAVGVAAAATLLAAPAAGLTPAAQDTAPVIEVFTREGCPHCARALRFLAVLADERPDVHIQVRDVVEDPAAVERLVALARERGVTALGVPAFHLAGRLLIGFADDETTGAELRRLVEQATPSPASPPDVVQAPLLGPLSASRLGLPAFTFLIGLVDGFNPCAMWALLYLLSLLVNLQDRVKMFAIAGTFVLVGGVIYFAFIAAWLELFFFVGLSRAVQLLLGGLACGVGAVNVKDFVVFKRGISLTIPESVKPTVYARMRRVLTAENLVGAMVAVAALAVLINFVELLCTAGLPAVYTRILAAQELPRVAYYGYLGLYIVAYILDDSVVLAVAVVTLSRRRLQARGGRWLKLVSGAVMLALGVALVVRPEWLF